MQKIAVTPLLTKYSASLYPDSLIQSPYLIRSGLNRIFSSNKACWYPKLRFIVCKLSAVPAITPILRCPAEIRYLVISYPPFLSSIITDVKRGFFDKPYTTIAGILKSLGKQLIILQCPAI